MRKHHLTISKIFVAAVLLFKPTDLSVHPIKTSVADTAISAKPQATDKAVTKASIDSPQPDSLKTAKLQKPSLPPDSLRTDNVKSWFSNIRNWANRNEGFIGLNELVLGLLGFGSVWALFRYLKFPVRRFFAKKRYLNFIIKYHQHLPVVGFETDLLIPIPLKEAYVTLWARTTELGPFYGKVEDPFAPQPAHITTVEKALKFAIEKRKDGVVVLGQTGSGKTTLTQFFLLCFATGKANTTLGLSQKFLPALLSLRDVDPTKSILENILSPSQKNDLRLDDDFFETYLRQDRIILLLDGLDEVSNDEKRQQVSQWIHQVHCAFPQCPVIVTSRFSGYRGSAILPGNYLRLEIQDHKLSQVKQFIENWLTMVETHLHENTEFWRQQARLAARDLYHRIETTPALRELAVNPLMLQIIVLVHRRRNTALPERRVELYNECIDVLLEPWEKAKNLKVLLSAAEARQLLQPVALWIHAMENRREASKPEILNFIMPRLSQVNNEIKGDDLLRSWQERSGIIKAKNDSYFFHQLCFQEYLAAEEIRKTRQIDLLVKNFNNAWWRELTLLTIVSQIHRFLMILCELYCLKRGTMVLTWISCCAVLMKQ